MSDTIQSTESAAGPEGAEGAEMQTPYGVLRPHRYDGIMEYDNPPPGWLTGLFFASIIFSLVYIPYYLAGYIYSFDTPAVNLTKELEAEAAKAKAEAKAHPERSGPTDADLRALVSDSGRVEQGKTLFAAKCAPCHGPQAQGLIGPNLTDNAWLHGGKPTEIRHTIVEGVPAKGMIPWGSQLKSDEIDALVAFVLSVRGSNPPNPKAPEGEVVDDAP